VNAKQIFQRVQQVFPDAEWSYVKALINDGLLEIGRFKPQRKESTFNVVTDQLYYGIGDKNSDLRVDKIYSVAVMDSDGNYRKIPRITDYNKITNIDRS